MIIVTLAYSLKTNKEGHCGKAVNLCYADLATDWLTEHVVSLLKFLSTIFSFFLLFFFFKGQRLVLWPHCPVHNCLLTTVVLYLLIAANEDWLIDWLIDWTQFTLIINTCQSTTLCGALITQPVSLPVGLNTLKMINVSVSVAQLSIIRN